MVGRPTCGDKYLETSVHMRIHYNPTFLIYQHSQYLKRSLIREQVCTSFSALPIFSQRKVVVPYSSLGQSFNFSHLSTLLSPSSFFDVEYLVVQPVKAQYNVLFKKKFKYYHLLQQVLDPPSHSFPLPPIPSRFLPLPLAPSHSLSLWSLISVMSLAPSHFSSPAQSLAFSF